MVIITILLVILMMLILVIPHEFGHFIVGKIVGMRINEFSVGMGPFLFQRQHGETMYSLRLLPIGGYCAFEAENEESEDPRAFNNKPVWAKLAVLLAGAFMNILIALVIIIGLITYTGLPTNVIGTVEPASPAYEAGIKVSDEIVKINDKEVSSWSDVVKAISATEQGSELQLVVSRDGKEVTTQVTPKVSKEGRTLIGITAKPTHNIFKCAPLGAKTTWYLNRSILESLMNMFHKGIKKDEVSGIVGMSSMVNQTVQIGFANYLYLVAIISLNLAIFNLLPFPALDGGRIIFVIIRRITGNMISDKVEGYVHLAGMAVLLGVFVLVTWNDIAKIFFS